MSKVDFYYPQNYKTKTKTETLMRFLRVDLPYFALNDFTIRINQVESMPGVNSETIIGQINGSLKDNIYWALIKRLLLVMGFYTICRISFYLFNHCCPTKI